MAYFADYLILKGTFNPVNSNDLLEVLFLNSNFKIRGYFGKQETENSFGIQIPNLIFNLSETDTLYPARVSLSYQKDNRLIGQYEILSRETVRNSKTYYEGKLNFNWMLETDDVEIIDCSLKFSEKEMSWINVGISPAEMEDRVIMFVDDEDNSINFFTSWAGAGYYKAYFRTVAHDPVTAATNGFAEEVTYEVYQLIAVKRTSRDREGLLADFSAQINYHFDTLEFAKHQQDQVRLKLLNIP